MVDMSERKAVIFPIIPSHVSRFFDEERDIFVKFTKMKLKKGMLLIFYVSKEMVLAGEAKITKVEQLYPDVAWESYRNRIFLDREEYDKYVGFSPISREERKTKDVLVLSLSSFRKYDPTLRVPLSITPSVRYITKETYARAIFVSKRSPIFIYQPSHFTLYLHDT